MRRLIAPVLVLGVGCTVFFNPSKVPCAPATCLPVPNAVARCEQNTCLYGCASGFTDFDKDLEKAESNGCEAVCLASAPAAPAQLHALVGSPSGGVNWLWDPSPGAHLFRLCTGADPGKLTSCTDVTAATACARPLGGFACSATTTGHTNNVRVYARLQAIEGCGKVSPETTTQSTTPINGELTSLGDFTVEGNTCNAAISTDAGVARIQLAGACVTALVFGDDAWRDFTLRADVKLTDNGRAFTGGVAFHFPSTLPKARSSFGLVQETPASEISSAFTAVVNGVDRATATSIEAAAGNQWTTVELIAADGDLSAAFGTVGLPLKPVLRWREPTKATGRFGLYLGNTATDTNLESVEFRNLSVSTRAVLPDAGTGSRKFDFSGSTFPPGMRAVTPPMLTDKVRLVPCPSPRNSGAGCPADGGCQPASASCVEIDQGILQRISAAFDQPLGLDPTRPWRLSFKFLTSAMGTNAQILRTPNLTGSILRGPDTGLWSGKVWAFGAATDAGIGANLWNRVDFTFSQNTYSLEINSVPVVVGAAFPPSSEWDRHLGAFVLGGPDYVPNFPWLVGNIHAWWTDLEIVQLP